MSTSARNAGLCAVGLSSLTFISLALYMPTFMKNVHNIQELLKVRSDEFKAIADEAWEELLDARTTLPRDRHARQLSGNEVKSRLRKAYPLPDTFVIPEKSGQTCTCQQQNNCPSGPRGAAGKNGEDGTPGLRGEPGPPGIVGIVPPIEVRGPSCRPCPSGPRGASGNQGI
ncbi:Col-cuticle-N domain-containing protein [Aphelenchoides bicaudatus]|nr:Col-cuticle-N domain-containing protein [Aphelenchoides bicaudatus]